MSESESQRSSDSLLERIERQARGEAVPRRRGVERYWDERWDLRTESEIENIFAYELSRSIQEDVRVRQQEWIRGSRFGDRRVDFLLDADDEKGAVVLECDGRGFHSVKDDVWRDAAIWGAGAARVIYRFRGQDIFYHHQDIFHILAFFEPRLIAGHPEPPHRRTSAALARGFHVGDFSEIWTNWVRIVLPASEAEDVPEHSLEIIRWDADTLRARFEFAKKTRGTLADVQEAWPRQS